MRIITSDNNDCSFEIEIHIEKDQNFNICRIRGEADVMVQGEPTLKERAVDNLCENIDYFIRELNKAKGKVKKEYE